MFVFVPLVGSVGDVSRVLGCCAELCLWDGSGKFDGSSPTRKPSDSSIVVLEGTIQVAHTGGPNSSMGSDDESKG